MYHVIVLIINLEIYDQYLRKIKQSPRRTAISLVEYSKLVNWGGGGVGLWVWIETVQKLTVSVGIQFCSHEYT